MRPSRHALLHGSSLVFVFSAVLGILLGFHILHTPPSLAAAQPQNVDAVSEVVERWTGTVTIMETKTDTYADCPWLCDGNSHSVKLQEWNLSVDEEGSVNGTITTELVTYNYDQTRTNLHCGPVAETDYFLLDCQYTFLQVSQPRTILQVQGERKISELTQKPVLELTAQEVMQECETQWSARGIHSITGAIVHKQEEISCGASYHLRTYNIITPEGDDSNARPMILLDDSFSCCGITTIRTGYIVATTVDPLLELDREMLDRSIFLDQVPVEELFTANMDWNSPDGGWVTWQLGEAEPEQVGPTEDAKLPKTINNGMQGVGKKKLTVQARSGLNVISKPEVTQVTVAPPPAWTGGPGAISATKVQGAVTYKSTFKFPEPPFQGTVNVPQIVPFMGGKELGISDTQGSFSWEAQSTSEGQGSLSGQTGFSVMGKGVTGSLSGRARIQFDESGIKIPEGGMDFSISGTIASDEEPLLKAVPSLRPAILVIEKISSQAAAFINERAKAKLELQPKLDFGFTFQTENDEIKFKNAEVKPGFGFRTVAQIKLIEDVLQASTSIGGSIAAAFKVPPPYFKEVALQGLIQAQIVLYRWVWEGEKAWSLVISGASAALADAGDLLAQVGGSWQPLDRSYIDKPNYALWHGDSVAAQAITAIVDQLLVENVFPLANPSLHVRADDFGNTRTLQTWTHDDPNDPELSSGEIAYSNSNNGGNMTTPQFLTNDEQDDFNPKAVTLTNNQRLFVWQRMDTPNPPDFNDDPAGYLSHWQIVSQRIGGDDDFEELSTPGSLNYRHQLGVLSDGALAVWVNNPDNYIIGDASHPDHILFARYVNVGDTWQPTSAVISDVVGLLDLKLATNGDHAALVYSLDTNGTVTSTNDVELFYTTWNGTTWSAPTRLTNNNVPDERPQLALAADGTPLLVWRQGGTLKFLKGAWNAAPVDLPVPGAAERSDYALAQSQDGHLALIWQEAGPEDTRIAYALYDAEHSVWGSQLTVPLPEGIQGAMATNISAAFLPADDEDEDEKGALLFAYQLAHVEMVTRTVNQVETDTGIRNGVTIANIADIVQHDLQFITLPLEPNLSISAAALSLPSADTLQAVIHNTGPRALANVPVILHLGSGDPVSGATQRIAQTIPLIASGASAVVNFSIAGRSESIFTVEIDPEATLGESDRSDNVAVLGTDLAITMLPATYDALGATLHGVVTQQGSRYVSLIASTGLTLNTPDGEHIGGSEFGFPLEPTNSVTVSAFISTTRLGAGRHQLYWTLDPEGNVADPNRENNIAGTTIMILPDLAGEPEQITFSQTPGNTAAFSMTVQNLGNWASTEASLEVFDGPPGDAASHSLLKTTIPTIQPGSSVLVSGQLQLAGLPAATSGLKALYVVLDADRVVDENNENNNLLAAGEVLESAGTAESGGPLYLPAIQR